MLNIDWVFAHNLSYRELIILLANCPHEEVFSTDLVTTLVEVFLDRFKSIIIKRVFIPYVVYFLITVSFLSTFTREGFWSFNDDDQRIGICVGCLIVILDLYLFYFEIYNVLRDGWSYFTDPFNYFDLATSVLNILLVIGTIIEDKKESQSERDDIRSMASLTVILMWIKSFYWMRLSLKFSQYVRLIKATLSDIKRFLLLQILILAAFGNAVLILNEGRSEEQ